MSRRDSSENTPPPASAAEDSVLGRVEAAAGAAPVVRLPGTDSGTEGEAGSASPVADLVPAHRASYRVLGEIARGGIGVILRSRDEELGRDVAMKVLREEHQDNPLLLQRFVEEAQINGQLQHPGIVPIYEMGLRADRRPYFTMKLIKGRTLADLLGERRGPEERRHRFLQIFEQVCQTMAYAHSRGVIHRDLKPANVMVGAFGEVQVVDWGFAKVLAPDATGDAERRVRARESSVSLIETARSTPGGSATTSLAGSILGTPAYMAPEQARGEVDATDTRSDVFALGGILCEILTGKAPYAEAEDALLAAAECKLGDARQRLERCPADAEVVDLCRACLAPAPAVRPRSAEVVAPRMQEYLAALDERARRAELEATRSRARTRITLTAAAALLSIGVVSVGAWVWIERGKERQRQTLQSAINVALDEASFERGLARGADRGDLSHWDTALTAVSRARTLAADPTVPGATRTHLEDLRAELEAGRQEAEQRFAREERQREFLARLESIRDSARHEITHPESSYPDYANQAYAEAFADYGLDLEAMDLDEACAAVAEEEIAIELASVLDEWARVRRMPGFRPNSGPLPGWQRLIHIAQAADPDEPRNQVRDAVLAGDVERLLELARSPGLEELPAATLTLLGSTLLAEGEQDAALDLFQLAQQMHPQDYRINVFLGMLLETELSFENAARYYSVALALRPESEFTHRGLAEALIELGDLAGAERVARTFLAEDPQVASAWFGLAAVQSFGGKYAAARASLSRGLELEPDWPQGVRLLGEILDQQGDTEGAVAAWRSALELDPTLPYARLFLAEAQLAAGDLETAIEEYRASNLLLGRCIAGELLFEQGEVGKAESLLGGSFAEMDARFREGLPVRDILAFYPMFLATCSVERLRDLPRARELAERSVREAPRDFLRWRTVAEVRFLDGDWRGAVLAGERGDEDPSLVERDGPHLFAWAMALWHLGRREEARQLHERAVAWQRSANPVMHTSLRRLSHALGVQAADLLGRTR
jgi:serine/threonine-protein kinase